MHVTLTDEKSNSLLFFAFEEFEDDYVLTVLEPAQTTTCMPQVRNIFLCHHPIRLLFLTPLTTLTKRVG